MTEYVKKRRSGRVEVALPIRVRGMSRETKFFDEPAETILISKNGFLTRLRAVADLEAELHVLNLQNNRGCTFRVVWMSDPDPEGFHNLGLELVDAEEDFWGIRFPSPEPSEGEVMAQAWLACQRCRQEQLTTVPEAEIEYLTKGFVIARNCERCKATTIWEFTPEQTAAASPGRDALAAPSSATGPEYGRSSEEQRESGRAPLKLRIKVFRTKHGIEIEDICETLDVSRSGAYFLTDQHYDPGESIRVVMPYKHGDIAIPVPARVVRTCCSEGSPFHGVAVHLERGKK